MFLSPVITSLVEDIIILESDIHSEKLGQCYESSNHDLARCLRCLSWLRETFLMPQDKCILAHLFCDAALARVGAQSNQIEPRASEPV